MVTVCLFLSYTNTVESRDYAPLLCMLASGKTWMGAYSRDRDIAA